MIVASFNANSIRARLDIVLRWLRTNSPDILGIQETKVQDDDFPEEPIKEAGYNAVYCGQKSYNGVAIISKTPLEDVRTGFDGKGTGGTRLISGVARGVTIINTYVPQGLNPSSERFREKLDWFDMFFDYIDENFTPRDMVIWLGDFNVAPDERDLYDPELLYGQVGFHPDEHAALDRFRRWGFVDVFRLHEKGKGFYTFWDYRIRNAVKRGMGWRVDHIWATRPVAERSRRAWIDTAPRLAKRPSDHTFIAAEFDL